MKCNKFLTDKLAFVVKTLLKLLQICIICATLLASGDSPIFFYFPILDIVSWETSRTTLLFVESKKLFLKICSVSLSCVLLDVYT